MVWQRMLNRLVGGKKKTIRNKKRRLLVESLAHRELLAVDFGAIGGVAFVDNANGGLTMADVRLEDVQIQLFKDVNTNGTFETGTDTFVDSTFSGTGANAGNYRFDGLSAGHYLVVQGSVAGQVTPDPVAVQVVNDSGVRVVAIDTYETATAPIKAHFGTTVATAFTAAPEAIGGERDVQVQYLSGNSKIELEVDDVGDTLTVSSGAGTTGAALLQYDGIDGDITLNPPGLGGQNLSDGDSAAGFEILVGADNPGGKLKVSAYTDATNYSTHEINIPDNENIPERIFVPFSIFRPDGGKGADFTKIGAVEASIIAVANMDTTISIVESIQPEVVTANLPNIQPIVLRAVDVAVTKTVSGTPIAGQDVTYTLMVVNNGTNQARGIRVTDTLVSDLTFVDGSFDPGTSGVTLTQNGQQLTFDVGILDADATATFTFDVSIASSATGTILNVVRATTTDNDTVSSNDSSSAAISVQQQIDLILKKTVDRATAIPGQDKLVYTIVVSHEADSPSDATNVVITDVLPAGVAGTAISAPSATSAKFNNNGETATVIFDSLPVGETRTFTITVDVNPDAIGTLTNSAEVTAAEMELDTTNNNDTAVTDLNPQFDLTIDKAVRDTTPGPGANVTYTINLQNIGPSTATGVVLTDTVPAGLTFVSGTLNGQNATGTSSVRFPAITLQPDQTATASLVFTVDASVSGEIVNTASVAADNGETNTNNNDGDATITVTPVFDLSVAKTVDQPVAQAGSTLQYTMTVSNSGPSTAVDVQAVDTLPSGVTFVSGTGPQGETLSLTDGTIGTITVNGGDLAANASFTFTINATVNSGVTANQTNSVSVSTVTPESNTANNTATVQTRIDPATASIAGTVYMDANNNAQRDTAEAGIAGVALTLTGTDSAGNNVSRSATTDANGDYMFANLAEGVYQIQETQPADFEDGMDFVGAINAIAVGEIVNNDEIRQIVLAQGQTGTNYNFAETNQACQANNYGGSDNGSDGGSDNGSDGDEGYGSACALVGSHQGYGGSDNGSDGGSDYDTDQSGVAWNDNIDNGYVNDRERDNEGVTIPLIGTNLDCGVDFTMRNGRRGIYVFEYILTGIYKLTERQPSAIADGTHKLGWINGVLAGELVDDAIQAIYLATGECGNSYNFGEPEAEQATRSERPTKFTSAKRRSSASGRSRMDNDC